MSIRERRAIRFQRETASDEHDIVRAAVAGSPIALETFVKGNWDFVFRAAFLICADRHEAEDLSQEAMLKAIAALPTFDQSRSLRPWLSRIAANTAHDWMRRRQRRPEGPLNGDEIPLDEEEEGLVDSIASQPFSRGVGDALLTLNPEFRSVVVMKFLLDLDDPEIAEILEISPVTVRTRLHRALSMLRKVLVNKEDLYA